MLLPLMVIMRASELSYGKILHVVQFWMLFLSVISVQSSYMCAHVKQFKAVAFPVGIIAQILKH